MKTTRFFIAAIICIFSIAVVYAGGETESSEPIIALVTDVGGIDDKSFNQSTWEGVERFAKEFKIKGYTYLQSESDADYIPNLSTVSDEGYKLVVAPGFLFTEAVAEVAANYPDVHYLIIDTVVADQPNVVSAIFSEEQGSFLVGVVAGLQAKKEGITKVGFIGGIDFDVIQRFESGYEAGVAAVAPNVEVMVEYAGAFNDAQKGQTIGAKLYDQGAGIIFMAAGGTGNGTIKEAKDRTLQGNPVWTIGVDKDQYADGIYEGQKSVILTSMVKRVDVAAYSVAKSEMDGNFDGGAIIKFDLSNDGVGIPEKNPNVSKDILQEVEKYKEQIISGAITVPTLPNRLR